MPPRRWSSPDPDLTGPGVEEIPGAWLSGIRSIHWARRNYDTTRVVKRERIGAKSAQVISGRKSTLKVRWKDWCWSWNSTLATWCPELTRWKSPWCWERLKAKGEVGERKRWLDRITNSMDMSLSKLREIVKPGMLQSMGLKSRTQLSTQQQQQHSL